VVVLHALLAGQSVERVQPHAPLTQAWPLAFAVHTPQAAPLVPQAVALVPATQAPAEQQPPLQPVWLAPPHDVLQRWVMVLQVLPAGQSVARLQPQVPERHRWPAPFIVQSVQAAPVVPQAVLLLVPATHAPAEQQPPLHPVWLAPPQAVLHRCVMVLQVLPAGQSVATLQPHASLTHAWPALLAAQLAHIAPPLPQAVGDSAALPPVPRQVVPLQQPPEQDAAVQVHEPLHAWPARHGLQAPPPVPQFVGSFVWQTPAAQQPLGQFAGVQPQMPLLQLMPTPQPAHVAPPVPHCVFDSLASSTQLLPLQQPLQPVVVLQMQPTPDEHAWPVVHVPQEPPAGPHELVDCAWLPPVP
jgi:hypothetical protein